MGSVLEDMGGEAWNLKQTHLSGAKGFKSSEGFKGYEAFKGSKGCKGYN